MSELEDILRDAALYEKAKEELDKLRAENERLREAKIALQLVLDSVDYTSGACRLNEPIGGVLPRGILERAKQAVKK